MPHVLITDSISLREFPKTAGDSSVRPCLLEYQLGSLSATSLVAAPAARIASPASAKRGAIAVQHGSVTAKAVFIALLSGRNKFYYGSHSLTTTSSRLPGLH